MMDYYSQFPCPPEDVIIDQVLHILSSKYKFTESKMKQVIKDQFDKGGGIQSMGSMTGYHVFGKSDLIKRSSKMLDKTPRISFRSVALIIKVFLNIYHEILEKRYSLDGEGFKEAQMDFERLINSYKLVGNKCFTV